MWKWKSLSHVRLFATHGLYNPWNSPGQNTGIGNISLLQGIFPTQGSNPSLPHCRWILYQLSHRITTNCGKFLETGIPILPASWETCMQVKKQQLKLNMEQCTGSKLRKVKAVYCHPAYFNFCAEYIMPNAGLDESQARIKFTRRISTTSYMHIIPL